MSTEAPNCIQPPQPQPQPQFHGPLPMVRQSAINTEEKSSDLTELNTDEDGLQIPPPPLLTRQETWKVYGPDGNFVTITEAKKRGIII